MPERGLEVEGAGRGEHEPSDRLAAVVDPERQFGGGFDLGWGVDECFDPCFPRLGGGDGVSQLHRGQQLDHLGGEVVEEHFGLATHGDAHGGDLAAGQPSGDGGFGERGEADQEPAVAQQVADGAVVHLAVMP